MDMDQNTSDMLKAAILRMGLSVDTAPAPVEFMRARSAWHRGVGAGLRVHVRQKPARSRPSADGR